MLKFEHIEPGTRVRAYDHEPFPGRPERYLEGTVVRHEDKDFAKWLVVECEADATFTKPDHNRIGLEVYVPMEMLFEYDEVDRVRVLS
jgi:hypothetical protein